MLHVVSPGCWVLRKRWPPLTVSAEREEKVPGPRRRPVAGAQLRGGRPDVVLG